METAKTEKIPVKDELPCNPYAEIIGNPKVKAIWAFQAPTPDSSSQNLIASILDMVDGKRAIERNKKRLDFTLDLSPYQTPEQPLPLQIPQTPEALIRARDALLKEGIEIGLRYMNSARLSLDTSLDSLTHGCYLENVMNLPHQPTIIDIVDSYQVKHYINDILKDRYKKRIGLNIRATPFYLRSVGKGIVQAHRIEVADRPEWLRVVLAYDPSYKDFRIVTSDKILELLIKKDEYTLPEIKQKREHPSLHDTQKIEPPTQTENSPVRKTQKLDMSHIQK